MTMLVMAYLLNGEPVMKNVAVYPSSVQAFYSITPQYVGKDKVKLICTIFFKVPLKGHVKLLSPESCDSLQNKRNEAEWE